MVRLLILLSFILGFHQFHISQCTIEFIENENKLDVKIHIFKDDLELALTKMSSEKIEIEPENSKTDSLIYNYIQNHFSIQIEHQKQPIIFKSKKITKDSKAVWCHFEIQNIENLSSMLITNTILLDIYKDQKNIVKVLGPKKGYFMFEWGIESKSF